MIPGDFGFGGMMHSGFDPFSIALELMIALDAIGVGGATAGILGTIGAAVAPFAAAAAIYAVSAALMPKPPVTDAAKVAKTTRSVVDGDRHRIVGKALVAGNALLPMARNNVATLITAHADGELDGVEEYRISGRRVGRAANGKVLTAPFWKSDTASWVDINVRSGAASQVVFAASNATYPDLWPATARGDGIFMTEALFESPGATDEDQRHPQIYAGGTQTIEIIGRAPKIYDPRLGAWDDPGAWAWSDNAALVLLDLETLPRIHGGRERPISAYHLADIGLTADRCDAPTAWRGGVEPWARAWGVRSLGTDTKIEDVSAAIRASTGLDFFPTEDGLWTMRPRDDAPQPTAALDFEDVEGLEIDDGPLGADRKNSWKIEYYVPDMWQVAEADMTGVGWAVDRDGVDAFGAVVGTISLPFCPSPGQAGRQARRLAAEANAPRVSFRASLAGLALWGHAHARIGVDGEGGALDIIIDSVRLDGLSATSPVSITGRVVPVLDAYDPQAHEPAAPVTEAAEAADGTAAEMPVITAAAVVKAGMAAGPIGWAVRIRLDFSSGDLNDQQLMARPINGRKRDAWIPAARGDIELSLGTDAALQIPPQGVRPDGFEVSAASSRDFFDISSWTESQDVMFVAGVPPAAPGVTSSDNGDGSWTYDFACSLDTSYVVVTLADGTSPVTYDTTPSGGAGFTGSPAARRVTAYAWDDTPSATVTF